MDTSTTAARGAQRKPRWRVIDIVIAAVLAVAVGIIFCIWNAIGGTGYKVLDAVTPGIGGVAIGIWLLGGVLGGLIIRKPGAAFFVELLAASVSMIVGNQWGIGVIYSGLAQGIGAEIVFAIVAYRRGGWVVAMLSGVGSAVGAFLLELVTSGNYARTLEFNLIYLACVIISGAILAGLLGLGIVKALAATGALDRFPAGRELAARHLADADSLNTTGELQGATRP